MSMIKDYGHISANFSTSDGENLYLLARKTAYSWFLMRSPWPVLSLTGAYLIFVTKLGPHLMKNREPFNIQKIIVAYNLYQMLSNLHLLSMLFTVKGTARYLINHACHPLEPSKNPFWFAGFEGAYLYLISKLCDLIDTIFFVLRKKESHITFLHVYHHTNMALSAWYFLKYAPGEQLAIVGIVNSFVHVVMYAYYFLAALGPHMQKYLWWKVYITRLQMIQFLVYIFYMAGLILLKCDLPVSLSSYVILQGSVFFALFTNFYVKTYRKSKTNERCHQYDSINGWNNRLKFN